MSPKTKKRNFLEKQLRKIPNNSSLQEWLDKTSKIAPDLATALEGIYCGHEGRIHQEIGGEYKGIYIVMGWHTVAETPRVEYAYVG